MKKKTATYRTDLLAHGMNPGKQTKLEDLLKNWRSVAVAHGHEQWRLFFETGAFSIRHDVSRTGYNRVGTSFGQMIRHQVVGSLESFISNRQNEFGSIVSHSSLPDQVKHQLRFVNRWKAWFPRAPLTMKDGSEIPAEIRKLARAIMRHRLGHCRRPSFAKINMIVDQRCVTIAEAKKAKEFPLWLRLSTLEKGKPISIPLQTHPHFKKRTGARSLSVQINERDGNFRFGIMTDVSAELAVSREVYRPLCEELAIDLGLSTLVATDQGDLLGRRWLEALKTYDRKVSKLAAYRQSHGMRTRSPRYQRLVTKLRGFLKSEVNRVLNRLVAVRRPAKIIVEKLDFRNPELSRRMNRIIRNFGQRAFNEKLKNLQETFGIEIEERNPAYTSQECSCGYVDKRNRQTQDTFSCRWCGKTGHADVNGARRIRSRGRSAALTDPRRHRQDILADLVRQFSERLTRPKARPIDPRWSNPYFRDWADAVT